MASYAKKARIAAVLSLVLVFALMIIAGGFNSDWYRVRISDIYYPNSEGGMIHAQLFVPDNASSANPVPAILNMHGGSDYLQTVSNYSLELARRGYVVLSVDAYGSGSSDFVSGSVASNAGGSGGEGNSALKMDGGASLGIEQLMSYKFVDSNNIGLIGHSMGGTYIANAALEFADNIKAIMPWGSGSFVDMMKSHASEEFTFNVGYINATCDEMVVFATGEPSSGLLSNDQLKAFVGTEETIIPGQIYGDFSKGTARVIYTPTTTHIGNIINHSSIGALAEYFGEAMPTTTDITPDNQVWQYKEVFSILAIIALLAFLISLCFILLNFRVFSAIIIKEDTPPIKMNLTTKLVGLALCIIVPILTLHRVGLLLASKSASNLLPMNWANNLMWLVVVNTSILLVVLLVWHFIAGKKSGSCLAAYGYTSQNQKVSGKNILLSLVFAVCVVAVMYAIVNLCYSLFKIDFRIWQFGIMPVTLKRVAFFPIYALFYVIAFFFMNTFSIAVASLNENSKGIRGTLKQYLIGWLVGTGGYVIVLIVYYVGLRTTQRPPFFLGFPPFANGHPNSLVFSMKTTVLIPTFTFVSILNTALFKKTKNIYVGSFLTAFVVTLILICSNAFAR